jgi:phosphatidylglycerol:prolipoprotein diacylglycerol transferase
MHPILFTLPSFQFLSHEWGPFTLNSYGLMMALSFALSLPLLARDTGRLLAPKVGIRASEGFQKTWDMFVWVILSSLFGGRLFYVLENHEEFEGQWLDAFKLWQGGLVFYGGLLGALVAAWLWMRREKWPVVFFFDIAAPYILLGHAIGRVGCYLEGCCAGLVDDRCGVVFPGAGDGLPRLPTQLWEMVGDFLLFLLLLWTRGKVLRRPGVSFALYGLTYGLLRFVIEFWRRDGSVHTLGVFLSPSHALSAFLALAAAGYLVWAYRRPLGPPKDARRS